MCTLCVNRFTFDLLSWRWTFFVKIKRSKKFTSLIKEYKAIVPVELITFLQKRSAMFLEGACIYVQGIMGNLMRSLGGPEVWKILQKWTTCTLSYARKIYWNWSFWKEMNTRPKITTNTRGLQLSLQNHIFHKHINMLYLIWWFRFK